MASSGLFAIIAPRLHGGLDGSDGSRKRSAAGAGGWSGPLTEDYHYHYRSRCAYNRLLERGSGTLGVRLSRLRVAARVKAFAIRQWRSIDLQGHGFGRRCNRRAPGVPRQRCPP
jgi:hypothetical protein